MSTRGCGMEAEPMRSSPRWAVRRYPSASSGACRLPFAAQRRRGKRPTHSPAKSLSCSRDRLELLLSRSGDVAPSAITRFVARAFDIVVHVARTKDGRRIVREIAAVEDAGPVVVWRFGETTVRQLPS